MTRSYRNNNPGNLEHSSFTQRYGAVLEDGPGARFAKFPTAGKGVAVLAMLLSGSSYINLSIEQVVNRYAPNNENNTKAYIEAICKDTGLSKEAVIGHINAYQFIDLLGAITKHEGYEA